MRNVRTKRSIQAAGAIENKVVFRDIKDSQRMNSSKNLFIWSCSYCGKRHFSSRQKQKMMNKYRVCPKCSSDLSGKNYQQGVFHGIPLNEYNEQSYENMRRMNGVKITRKITKEVLHQRMVMKREIRDYFNKKKDV